MDLTPEKLPENDNDNVPKVEMHINLPAESKNELVQPEQIVGLCRTIMDDIQVEKDEILEAYTNFAEMVFNAGDATSASKEALVNLLKLRSDLVDKKTKLMEMLLKAHRDGSGPKTVTAHQHTDILIDKRKTIRELNGKDKKDNK